MSTKVFRDPIYTLISFDKRYEEVIINIINLPIFQRLRRIKQLGFSEYTFPTANHNRLAHSIGVAFLVGKIFDSLNLPDDKALFSIGEIELNKKQLRLVLCLAGLLHDIGHGPFSHAFEKLLPDGISHEQITVELIKNSEIREEIESCDLFKDIRGSIVKIITDILKGEIDKSHYWLKELISSQLDADRMDYLLRDAYMCGVPYASFDLKWLINNLEIMEIPQEDKRWGLVVNAEKGLYAAESFIISRYHMYEQIYFHKTTRAFEQLLSKIFERVKFLINKEKDSTDRLFFDDNLIRFIKNPLANLSLFVYFDDYYLMTLFNLWSNSDDEILSELCRDVLHRNPPKMIAEFSLSEMPSGDKYLEFRDRIRKKIGEEKEKYFYFEDDYKNVPYKDSYLLGETSPEKSEHIWVTYKGKIKDLAEDSPVLKTLRNTELKKRRFYLCRCYFERYGSELSWRD